MPKFFQQFGTEIQCAAILEKTHGPQGFSYPHCGELAPGFVQGRSYNILQCQACRHQTSLILDALIQSTKLTLIIRFLGIYLISQVRTNLSALALRRLFGISYPSAWIFKFKLMQTMTGCEVPYRLCSSVQVDDACLGRELSGSSADRGSENKVCIVAAVSLSDQEPLHVKLTPVPFIAKGAKYNHSSSWVKLSEGLVRFGVLTDADCQPRPSGLTDTNLNNLPHFVWLNTLLMKPKTSPGPAYHVLDFNKYASQCLAPFLNFFRRCFDHKVLRERLLLGAIVSSLRIYIWLRSAEASC